MALHSRVENLSNLTEGSAALDIIYCPSQLYLTHIFKLLTLSQTFNNTMINLRAFMI